MWLAAVDEDDNEFAEEVGDDDIGRKIRNTMTGLEFLKEILGGREENSDFRSGLRSRDFDRAGRLRVGDFHNSK